MSVAASSRITPPSGDGPTVRGSVDRGSRRRSRAGYAGRVTPWVGVIPAVLLIAVVLGAAVVQAVVVSLSDWRGIGDLQIVGFENYTAAFSDPDLLASILLTFGYAVASAAGIILLAVVLAAAVSGNVRGSAWYRIIWFLPGIAPGAAVAIFWATSFQPDFGVVNEIAKLFGFPGNSALLADPATAIIPAVFVTIWAGVGFAFLLMLGSMEQISPSLYEAARVDGASPMRQFFSVTLPLARPVIVTTAMLEFIWAFNGFTIVWALTRGGPGDATSILPVRVYEQAFQFAEYGPAAALAVIGSVILVGIGVVGLRLSRTEQ